jgi:hypothetical protein
VGARVDQKKMSFSKYEYRLYHLLPQTSTKKFEKEVAIGKNMCYKYDN